MDHFKMTQCKASKPEIGEVFYDHNVGEVKIWDGNQWSRMILPDATPSDTDANFRIFVANKISYAKITNNTWWLNVHDEVIQWLDKNNAGLFIEEFNAISFFDHKFATAFQLQYR